MKIVILVFGLRQILRFDIHVFSILIILVSFQFFCGHFEF